MEEYPGKGECLGFRPVYGLGSVERMMPVYTNDRGELFAMQELASNPEFVRLRRVGDRLEAASQR